MKPKTIPAEPEHSMARVLVNFIALALILAVFAVLLCLGGAEAGMEAAW